LRNPALRKGKTITLGLSGSDTDLSIRCNRGRSVSIVEHNPSERFTITVTITGYDDVRRQLQADELGNMNTTTAAEKADASGTTTGDNVQQLDEACEIDELMDSTTTNNHAEDLLAELEQMQLESQNLLSEAADDISKAQSSNVPLVHSDTNDPAVVDHTVGEIDNLTQPLDEPRVSDEARHPEAAQARRNHDEISPSRRNEESHAKRDAIEEKPIVVDSTPSLILPESVPLTNAPNEKLVRNEVDATEENVSGAQEDRLNKMRRDVLSDRRQPIEQKVFDEIIALETGVPVKKVREVQKQLWQAIMSPTMFGKQRVIFNFFPFGDFRLMRNRELVNMDFKSAPVAKLAEHDAVEEYPHTNFDGSDADSTHPPIATHAIRIAATVAPIVGLSPPVTYDVIFETLQLLLKVFGVGKRRIRFSDIGEFFPVVLRGTLQYHFRPYRPLIRFATESFRAIISLAENEGEGQLAFEANNGVPDRSRARLRGVGNGTYSRRTTTTDGKSKTSLVWVALILAFIVYQAVQFLVN